MRKIRTFAVSATVLGGLFLIGSLVHSRESQARAATYSSPVTVMNTTANAVGVRDEDSPGRNAFQAQLSLSASGTSAAPLTIPAGKRLVIDYVSASAGLPPAGTQPVLIIYSTLSGGPTVPYTLVPAQSTLAPQQFYVFQQVQLYGDSVTVSLASAGSSPAFFVMGVSISGHLIDMP